MSSAVKGSSLGDPAETSIIEIMRKEDYALETINNYGDNLLHHTAANGCYHLIKEILKRRQNGDEDSQNDCGWTPLMLAIRNGNIESVKLLLANGSNPDQSTSQGISSIALSAAVGRDMFEIVYGACPSALARTKNDVIGPLCVAAMKNDKELFFRLLELGLDVSDADEYTRSMMRKSSIPEIARLVELHGDKVDYWRNADLSIDNHDDLSYGDFPIPQMSSTLCSTSFSINQSLDESSDIPIISVSSPDDTRKNPTSRLSKPRKINFIDKVKSKSFASPRLDYIDEKVLPGSPYFCHFARRQCPKDSSDLVMVVEDKIEPSTSADKHPEMGKKLCKYQINRPPNLQILNNNGGRNNGNRDSPISPNKTPIEARYDTPVGGMILDIHQQKIALVLKRFGLTHFIPTFLDQEVDLDLFLSLNDQDLQEIGIDEKSDRNILLSVVTECNRNPIFI